MRLTMPDGATYRVPAGLNDFRQALYTHLIAWKWRHLTTAPGEFRGRPYDAILPAAFAARLLPVHPSIAGAFEQHRQRFPFKLHRHLGHMASSQAACANLFLPLLQHPDLAAEVLHAIKPDLARIAIPSRNRSTRKAGT